MRLSYCGVRKKWSYSLLHCVPKRHPTLLPRGQGEALASVITRIWSGELNHILLLMPLKQRCWQMVCTGLPCHCSASGVDALSDWWKPLYLDLLQRLPKESLRSTIAWFLAPPRVALVAQGGYVNTVTPLDDFQVEWEVHRVCRDGFLFALRALFCLLTWRLSQPVSAEGSPGRGLGFDTEWKHWLRIAIGLWFMRCASDQIHYFSLDTFFERKWT